MAEPHRRILVTGASSGIGTATARALVAAGHRVALLARSADRIAELAGELDAVAVPADVTDLDALTAAVDGASDALGGLDGLINSAGVAMTGGVQEGDPAHWRTMFDVNVLGLLYATRAALPHLRRADLADVVNISSMSGRRVASAELAIYAGSKHAVHAISQGMATELKETPVRVTVIASGYVDTPIFDAIDETYGERTSTLGLSPEDVADQVLHVVEQPADIRLVEVAMVSTRQG